MPTHEEVFTAHVRALTKMLTRPCYFCQGPNAAMPRPFREGDSTEDPPVCPECNGTEIVAPTLDTASFRLGVLEFWVGTMSATRSLEKWGDLSVQWDVLDAWCDQVRKHILATDDAGMLRETLVTHAKILGDELDSPPPKPPKVTVTPLTLDELRELGIEGPGIEGQE